ncbi:hypothetical protein PROPHIGD54-2_63 [Mycobacterium phage prophiGD54-2]|nr:hypothetical protein PROPHIGD54-2_63 [Mycobacterium phage prophiGD54-2]
MSTAKEWLAVQSIPLPKCHEEWSFAYADGELASRDEVGELTEAQARAYVEADPERKLMQRTITEWYEVE